MPLDCDHHCPVNHQIKRETWLNPQSQCNPVLNDSDQESKALISEVSDNLLSILSHEKFRMADHEHPIFKTSLMA